jgi:phytanoyl-CoA hydroxylase
MSPSGLTAGQLEFWSKNGYLIIPDAISPEVVEELVKETGKLLDG